MMNCATCGRMIPDNTTSCPYCGALTELGRASQSQSSYYQQPQQGYVPPQQQGYMPPQQPGYNQQQGYVPPQQGYYQQPNYGQAGYGYQPGGVNVTITNNAPAHNSTPVIVELLLNIFLGVYGVGWLMAGETTTGVILLVCSFMDWFIIGAIAILTLGLGFLCWGPLIIAAWIVNAIMLNNALKRKAAQVIMVQQRY